MLPVLFIQDDRVVTAAGTPPDRAQIQLIQKIAETEGPEQEKALEYLTHLADAGLLKSAKGESKSKTEGETKPPVQ